MITANTLTTELWKCKSQVIKDRAKKYYGIGTHSLAEGIPEKIGQKACNYIQGLSK